jgi:hypothetical protein
MTAARHASGSQRPFRSLALRLLGASLVAFLGTLAFCGTTHAHDLRQLKLLVPRVAGMLEIQDRVFADEAMSEIVRVQLVDAIAGARETVQICFPDAGDHPVIVACSTRSCFHRMGAKGGRGLQWGGRVLLAPNGISPAIVAHEWIHAVVDQKLGLGRTFPTWFHEGLAAHFSQDDRYSAQAFLQFRHEHSDVAVRLQAIDRATTKKQFFRQKDAYLLAAERVRGWLQVRGMSGLDYALRSGEI